MSFTAANVLAAPPVELPYVGIDEINEERAVKVIRALVQCQRYPNSILWQMNGLPRDGIEVLDNLKDHLVGAIDIPSLPGVFLAFRSKEIGLDCLLRATSKLLWKFRDRPETVAHRQYCNALVWARTDSDDEALTDDEGSSDDDDEQPPALEIIIDQDLDADDVAQGVAALAIDPPAPAPVPIVKAAKNGRKGKGKGKAKSKSKPAPKNPKPVVDELTRAGRLAVAKTIREVKRAAELVRLDHAREKPRRGHRPHGEDMRRYNAWQALLKEDWRLAHLLA